MTHWRYVPVGFFFVIYRIDDWDYVGYHLSYADNKTPTATGTFSFSPFTIPVGEYGTYLVFGTNTLDSSNNLTCSLNANCNVFNLTGKGTGVTGVQALAIGLHVYSESNASNMFTPFGYQYTASIKNKCTIIAVRIKG